MTQLNSPSAPRRGVNVPPVSPFHWLAFLFGGVLGGYLLTLHLDWQDQLVLGALMFGVSLVISRFFKGYSATLAMISLSIFSTIRYLIWRLRESYDFLALNGFRDEWWDLACVGLLLLAELYAITTLILGYFQSLRPLHRKPVAMPADVSTWPTVDIFIPTYNEPLDVLKPTTLLALTMDWPHDRRNVYILDDGNREEVRAFAEAAGAGYITRMDNTHAKAGNINNALGQTDGEFVAIFDCDHVPTRSFLQTTMGWFMRDRRMAMLQTPHHFFSPDPLERNLNVFRKTPNEGLLFYGLVQDGNDFWNATFFCGSCAVMRRSALDEIGGIAVETVTEDAHTALRMQGLGWNTAYIKIPQAAGLATANLRDHIRQRIRWARGMAQILRVDNPLLARGLSWGQRLCYFNAASHFLHAGPRLVFLTAPLAFLLFDLTNFYGYFAAILAYALPHIFLATVTNSRIQGQYRHMFWNEVYETVLSPYIFLPTLIALIAPKHGKFNVTPKQGLRDKDRFDWGIAAPYVVLSVLNMIGIGVAGFEIYHGSARAGALAVNGFWAAYNLLVLGVATSVAWERRQRRVHFRVPVRLAARLEFAGGMSMACETLDLSQGGAAIDLPSRLSLPSETEVEFVFALHDGEHRVRGHVVETDALGARVQFAGISLRDEQQIARLIYSRADAWFDWDSCYRRDAPLRSLGQLFVLSVKGLLSMPRAVFQALGDARDSGHPGSLQRQAASPLFVLCILALLTWFAMSGNAQSRPRSNEQLVFHDALDMNALGRKQPLALEGIQGRAELNFGVPITKVVSHAALMLEFRPAAALDPRLNTLTVHLNGIKVGSYRTTATLRQGVRLDLPADLLLRDNILAFELDGECGPACQGAPIGALRSEIALNTSVLLDGHMLSISSDFSLLPAPFFDRSSSRSLHLPFVFETQPDAEILRAAGMAASWFGMQVDYRGARFPVSLMDLPKGNSVVFAQHGSTLALRLGLTGLQGPVVAIRNNPQDQYGKVLAFLGAEASEIRQAVLAFASDQLPSSGATAELGTAAEPEAREAYDVPRWLPTGEKTPLTTAGATDSLRVYGGGSVNLYFRLAPDLYFGNRKWAPMRLHYRYEGLGEGVEGILKIHLNGNEVSTFKAESNENGASSHLVRIPVEWLTFGNTLTVEFAFDRSGAAPGAASYPVGEVLPETYLDLGGTPHFAELPRLDLFANAGYPFTRYADLAHTAVVLPQQPSAEQMGIYLDLLGFFGAQTGHPALKFVVALGTVVDLETRKDFLVIDSATQSELSGRWTGAMDVRVDGYPFRVAEPSFFEGLEERLPWSSVGEQRDRLSRLLATPAGASAVIQGVAASAGDFGHAVILTTAQPGGVEQLGALLTERERTPEIYGRVSVLSEGRFESFELEEPDHAIGDGSLRVRAAAWLKRHLLILASLFLAAAYLLAWGLRPWTDRRAYERLQTEV